MKGNEFLKPGQGELKQKNCSIKNLNNSEILFDYLKDKATPLTAYELLNGLRSKGMVAPTTIYRALDKLIEAGRIHKIESLNAWTVCCEKHNKKTAIFEGCARQQKRREARFMDKHVERVKP